MRQSLRCHKDVLIGLAICSTIPSLCFAPASMVLKRGSSRSGPCPDRSPRAGSVPGCRSARNMARAVRARLRGRNCGRSGCKRHCSGPCRLSGSSSSARCIQSFALSTSPIMISELAPGSQRRAVRRVLREGHFRRVPASGRADLSAPASSPTPEVAGLQHQAAVEIRIHQLRTPSRNSGSRRPSGPAGTSAAPSRGSLPTSSGPEPQRFRKLLVGFLVALCCSRTVTITQCGSASRRSICSARSAAGSGSSSSPCQ